MSKLYRLFVVILFAGALLAACSSQSAATLPPVTNPYAPQPGDEKMMRGDPEIVSASVLMTESLPHQVSVSLAYRLSTPCYQLRVSINPPDSQNHIQMAIYSVAPKDKPCNLMALQTPMESGINLGSFPTGHYSVWVNGQQVGEFDAQ